MLPTKKATRESLPVDTVAGILTYIRDKPTVRFSNYCNDSQTIFGNPDSKFRQRVYQKRKDLIRNYLKPGQSIERWHNLLRDHGLTMDSSSPPLAADFDDDDTYEMFDVDSGSGVKTRSSRNKVSSSKKPEPAPTKTFDSFSNQLVQEVQRGMFLVQVIWSYSHSLLPQWIRRSISIASKAMSMESMFSMESKLTLWPERNKQK